MRVYVETNFVLELTFRQEQFQSCEEIVELQKQGHVQVVIPAFSLTEPHEKLHRQSVHRKQLSDELDPEIKQLIRTEGYAQRVGGWENFLELLVQSGYEERQHFVSIRTTLLQHALVLPLEKETLRLAADFEQSRILSPQDAIIYASVVQHLQQTPLAPCCFLNRNTRDFSTSVIKQELRQFSCRLIPDFNDGLAYIQSQLPR